MRGPKRGSSGKLLPCTHDAHNARTAGSAICGQLVLKVWYAGKACARPRAALPKACKLTIISYMSNVSLMGDG